MLFLLEVLYMWSIVAIQDICLTLVEPCNFLRTWKEKYLLIGTILWGYSHIVFFHSQIHLKEDVSNFFDTSVFFYRQKNLPNSLSIWDYQLTSEPDLIKSNLNGLPLHRLAGYLKMIKKCGHFFSPYFEIWQKKKYKVDKNIFFRRY